MHCRSILWFAAATAAALLASEKDALAQGQPQYPPYTTPMQPYPQQGVPQTYPPQQYPPQTYPPQYPAQPGGTYPGYGYPVVQPTTNSRARADSEIAFLYGTGAIYGVGLGIWVDAEAKIGDPGLNLIFPVVLGVAAPVGVYFLDRPDMDRGLPGAISAGLFLGASEGLGIWSVQFTHAGSANEWGFRGMSRSVALGATLGGVGGFAAGYYLEPSPKSSALVASAGTWGALVGSMIGYGSSGDKQHQSYKENNDGASTGGLVGFNVGMVAAAGLSFVYTPSWMSLAWMWIGGGIGAAAGLPIYLAYINSDHAPQRGLIFQGLTTTLGIAAGGIFSSGLKDDDYITVGKGPFSNSVGQITMVSFMPVQGGGGLQVGGFLF